MMLQNEYFEEKIQLRRKIDHLNIWENPRLLMQFNLVSANLRAFLPSIDYTAHEGLFRELLMNQHLCEVEQEWGTLQDQLAIEPIDEAVWQRLRKKPSMICTFHTGSYRLLNLLLGNKNIPFTLVVASAFKQKYEVQLQDVFMQNNANGKGAEELRIIDAEAGNAALKMMREIGQGRSLLVYVDGNTGAGTATSSNANHVEVSFLARTVFARKGIGFIAHKTKIPVTAFLSYRKPNNTLGYRVVQVSGHEKEENKELAIHRIMQDLYDALAETVAAYPGQWDAWQYVHHMTKTTASSARFNFNEYGLFAMRGKAYLFDKNSFESHEISSQTYSSLHHSYTYNRIERASLDPAIYEQLEELNVII